MSASFFCVSWNEPIGRSNWILVFAYSSADTKHERAAPITPQMIPNRASFRQVSGPRSPRTSGSLALQLDRSVGSRADPADVGQLHPEEPQLPELLGELARGELAALVPVVDVGKDPVGDPLTGEPSDLPLLVGEQRIDVDQVER